MAGFRKHAVWGGIPYALFLVAGLGISLGWGALRPNPLPIPLVPDTPRNILTCLALAFLASLFPDTDIKSKSQQLIYRLLFPVNLVLIIMMRYEWSALLGLAAMFPLLGKHRGWTHSRITMLLLPFPFLIYPMYQTQQLTNWSGLPHYLAVVLGYGTHLFLDGRLLPFQKSSGR